MKYIFYVSLDRIIFAVEAFGVYVICNNVLDASKTFLMKTVSCSQILNLGLLYVYF